MSINQTQEPQVKASAGELWVATLNTGISTLNAINNTARVLEHTTGALADKAERFRAQIHIQDSIKHNTLMAQYQQQAADLGLNI